MSFNRGINKQTVVHPQSGILFGEKEDTNYSCNYIEEIEMQEKEVRLKRNILYNVERVKLWEQKTDDCFPRTDQEGSGWLQRCAQVKELSLWFWVLAAELYIFADTRRTLHHKECTSRYANTHIHTSTNQRTRSVKGISSQNTDCDR